VDGGYDQVSPFLGLLMHPSKSKQSKYKEADHLQAVSSP